MNKSNPDLCVLTVITDDSNPEWDERMTLIDTLEGLKRKFDIEPLPPGWTLLTGKAAETFLKQMAKDEARYQLEKRKRN